MPTDHLIPPVPKFTNKQLLKKVADDEGFPTVLAMLEHFVTDSICPGICTTCHGIEPSCEPDARDNACSECETNTVRSIFDLAGVI